MSDGTQKVIYRLKKKIIIIYVFLYLNSTLVQWRISLHL